MVPGLDLREQDVLNAFFKASALGRREFLRLENCVPAFAGVATCQALSFGRIGQKAAEAGQSVEDAWETL